MLSRAPSRCFTTTCFAFAGLDSPGIAFAALLQTVRSTPSDPQQNVRFRVAFAAGPSLGTSVTSALASFRGLRFKRQGGAVKKTGPAFGQLELWELLRDLSENCAKPKPIDGLRNGNQPFGQETCWNKITQPVANEKHQTGAEYHFGKQ